jgi:hypothetical protein
LKLFQNIHLLPFEFLKNISKPKSTDIYVPTNAYQKPVTLPTNSTTNTAIAVLKITLRSNLGILFPCKIKKY